MACGQGAKPGGGDGAGLAPGRDPVTVSVWHQNWASPDAETRSRAMLTELQERLPRARVDRQVVAWAGAGMRVGQGAMAGIDLGAYKEIARRGTRAWPTIPTANEYLTALTAAWNDVLQEKAAPEAWLREVGRLQQAELEQALQRKEGGK